MGAVSVEEIHRVMSVTCSEIINLRDQPGGLRVSSWHRYLVPPADSHRLQAQAEHQHQAN